MERNLWSGDGGDGWSEQGLFSPRLVVVVAENELFFNIRDCGYSSKISRIAMGKIAYLAPNATSVPEITVIYS